MHNPLRILHLEDDPSDRELVEAKLLTGEGSRTKIRQVDTKGSRFSGRSKRRKSTLSADYSLPAFDSLTARRSQQGPEVVPLALFIFVSGTMGKISRSKR